VLSSLGLTVCATGAVDIRVADAPPAFPAIAAFFALVGLVDLVVVVRRKLNGEPG
jgi:hypothetical protein